MACSEQNGGWLRTSEHLSGVACSNGSGPKRSNSGAASSHGINDRWAMFADEAYNVGVDAGLAKRVDDEVIAREDVDARVEPAAAMRALSQALAAGLTGEVTS